MAWYDTEWEKRKKITLTGGSSGAQTDYQVKLTITYDSDMQADFGDLRFTRGNGTTLLNAWLESKVDSTSAVVWVETDTPADTVESDIYMYYGNSGAASDWDGAATFPEYFDDFSSDTIADYTERHYSTWDVFTHKEITGGELHIGFNATGHGSAVLFHTANTFTNSGYAMRSRFRATGYHSDTSLFRHQKEIGLTTDTTPTYVASCGCNPDFSGWHSDGCIDMPDNHCQTTNISGTTTDEIVYSLDGSTYHPGFWVQDISSASTVSELWVSWALVRKDVTNPATHVYGDEEIEWYDSDWEKRKPITLTGGSDGAQTDYQIKLTVPWNSNMQADFSDLRFVKIDNTTLIHAWMEDYAASTSATIWVEFPTTPENGVTEDYYMYYGNSGASDAWNGDDTFLFYDDFPGTALDGVKWSSTTGSVVSSGELSVVVHSGNGSHTSNEWNRDVAFRGKVKRVESGDGNMIGFVDGWGTDACVFRQYTSNQIQVFSGGNQTTVSGNTSLTTYRTVDVTWLTNEVKYIVDGVEETNSPITTNVPTSSIPIGFHGMSSKYMYSEWVLVRKYTSNPATYAIGDETAKWYNSDWTKRRPIILTGGSSGAQTDYQVKLTITYDSDMQFDFDDLRFIKSDNVTVLDSWLESKTNSTSAIIWIETDTPANTITDTIYMYYGNSGASSVWNGTDTFVFFEGFEGTIGNYPSGWTGTSSTYFQYSNTQVHTGSTSAKLTSTTTRYDERRDIGFGTGAYALGYFAYLPSGGDFEHRVIVRDDTVDNRMCYSHFRIVTGDYNILGATSVSKEFTEDRWEKVELIPNYSTKQITSLLNDVSVGTVAFASTAAVLDRLWVVGDTADKGTGYIDDMYVRKYVANPTTYVVGDEESSGPIVVTGNAVWYYRLLIRRNL